MGFFRQEYWSGLPCSQLHPIPNLHLRAGVVLRIHTLAPFTHVSDNMGDNWHQQEGSGEKREHFPSVTPPHPSGDIPGSPPCTPTPSCGITAPYWVAGAGSGLCPSSLWQAVATFCLTNSQGGSSFLSRAPHPSINTLSLNSQSGFSFPG